MEGQELKEGKARVRTNLIDPLNSRGMIRKRGLSVDDHEKTLQSLMARLAYMDTSRLIALAEVVEAHAEGPRRNVWPSEVSITNWARRLQEPPAGQSRLVRTYMQSGAGHAARAGGYMVELFRHLKKYGAPPNDYSIKMIRQEADENARTRARIEGDAEQGQASPRELEWLAAYMDTRRRCLDIIGERSERAVA